MDGTYGNTPNFVGNISNSGLSIYDQIEIGDSEYWIPSVQLQELLDRGLKGLSLGGLPLRTRSKVIKQRVCEILGYPTPKSFKKTHPRFPGQNFDTYVQKSNNLQVWNEELSSTRRYVIIRVSDDDIVKMVKVIPGSVLAKLDTTGTLTQKYQARFVPDKRTELVSENDTENLSFLEGVREQSSRFLHSPTDPPQAERLLRIDIVYERLCSLVGKSFGDSGHDQERNRGAELHRLVCKALGYSSYRDEGSFPDIPNQLLEVKLQTSPTIDLGLVRPDSKDVLELPALHGGGKIRHCDVRYALFYAQTDGSVVTLTHFVLATGQDFFGRFPQFQGKVLNKKLQIPLPRDFFS